MQAHPATRREFLAASTAFFAAHAIAACGDTPPAKSATRILTLELQSATPLTKMKDFYHGSLGLAVDEDKAERLTLAAGATRLAFVPAAEGKPFYHFAFNIPENKIRAAREWQSKRTSLLPIPANLRDADYPDDVVNYAHWNAHSVFFVDPAGNVVEYIARHDLKNAAGGDFGSGDILCASEIAFVVDDVAKAAAGLKEAAGVAQYRGSSEQFAALGDESGLLLVMKRGRVISFDSPAKKAVTVFRTSACVRGSREQKYSVPEFPYDLTVVR